MKKKIAVCILTYNRINLLKRAIRSVLNSRYKDFQLIVFNDNSKDGTNEYLDTLTNGDSIIEIRHKKNLGQINNSNFMLDYICNNSEFDFFLILHDDDLISKYLIEEKIKIMSLDKDIAIVGSAWNIIDDNENIKKTNSYQEFKNTVILTDREYFLHHFKGLAFPWTGVLYRKSKINSYKLNNFYGNGADVIFLAEVILGNKVCYIPRTLYNYRVHQNQQSSLRKDLHYNYELWIKIFTFYRNLVSEKFNEKDCIDNLKIANNKTMLYFILESENLNFFFKMLTSKYLTIRFIKLKDYLRIIKKFFKLLFPIFSEY